MLRVGVTALALVVGALTAGCGGSAEPEPAAQACPASAPAPATAAPDSDVTVVGNTLRQGGDVFRAKGVAVGDPGYYDEVTKRCPDVDYRWLVDDWHANTVRISVSPGYWKHYHDKEFLALKRHVAAALDAGLFVIIDWHAIGWPDGYLERVKEDSGDPADIYDTSMTLAKSFWRTAATTFTDPRVAFEIWNEPTLGGKENGRARWAQLVPYWNALIGEIRRAGSSALVIATGNEWAHDLRGVKAALLTDTKVAYAWHVYAERDRNEPKLWAASLDGLDRVGPVIVTEWGFEPRSTEHHRADQREFGVPFRDQFLEGRSLSSTAWSAQPDYPPALVRSDWRTLTLWGKFAHDYLAG